MCIHTVNKSKEIKRCSETYQEQIPMALPPPAPAHLPFPPSPRVLPLCLLPCPPSIIPPPSAVSG